MKKSVLLFMLFAVVMFAGCTSWSYRGERFDGNCNLVEQVSVSRGTFGVWGKADYINVSIGENKRSLTICDILLNPDNVQIRTPYGTIKTTGCD